MVGMWKPVRNKDMEALQLIELYASIGLKNRLNKKQQLIKSMSDKLMRWHIENKTQKRLSKLRTDLDLECEQRDRLERALELCKELTKGDNNG